MKSDKNTTRFRQRYFHRLSVNLVKARIRESAKEAAEVQGLI